jgi:hypothetical protein
MISAAMADITSPLKKVPFDACGDLPQRII